MKKFKYENKIRIKITKAMILCSFILALLISLLSVFVNYKFLEKEAKEKLTLLPQNYSNNFNSDFNLVEGSVNALKHTISATFELEHFNFEADNYVKKYERIMESTIKESAENISKETVNGIKAVYFTINPELSGEAYEYWYVYQEEKGIFEIVDSDSDPQQPYINDFFPENKNMQWYYNPIIKGKGVWSDPYEEADLSLNIISYTEAIYKDDVLIGVVGMDINIDAMRDTIQNIKVYETGYAFLVCDDYHILIHPQYDMEDSLKNIKNGELQVLIDEIEKNSFGVKKINIKSREEILGYSHLSNGWILFFSAPLDEVYSLVIMQIFVNSITIFSSVFIIIPIALRVGKSISKPIVKITELIKNTSKFNFEDDKSLEALKNNRDEIGVMAREMYYMRKYLKETGVHKAAELQKQYLQRVFPIPEKANMEILYVPSKTVSGDFFHLEKIDDSTVVGVIWDVCGKGVTAALSISAFNILFNKTLLNTHKPIEILKCLNTRVSELLGDAYVAACCFSFNFEKRQAVIAGAGISEYIYWTQERKYEEKVVKGPFLGMFEDSVFDQKIIDFKTGDKFYFLTDGLDFILENDNHKKNYSEISSIKEFKDYVMECLNTELAETEGLLDDSTMIAIEVK
ncbi:SpoIIE family protein phosphatase [Oceanirhabdus sp. W0125-5]|uniref:SpoIIE family protein phosphatase n=1 Tax=Oceanirhabdus sp. W0125-5 TaxID=2999116 RepID=UPI0022F2F670|nr:SpoIIE family protein phosphatase [Oceanirhabdus sp. W0125-5]WBW95371.1 SpoIIE family protein phosphatase [Oceanirhabdus sp. W0125-5]